MQYMIVFSILLAASLSIGSFILLNLFVKRKKEKSIRALVIQWYKNITGRGIKLKKAMAILFLICGSFCYVLFFYNLSNRIIYHREVSGFAEWRESNNQKYLYVEADDHYSLGYLTGKATAMKIYLMKEFFLIASLSLGLDYSSFIKIGDKYLSYIPEKYQDEIRGIAEGATAGSGFHISFKDALIQSLFFEILYGQSETEEDQMVACTAFGIKNEDNTTLTGQNMDLVKPMRNFQYFVLHKLKNKPKIFTYRIGASLAIAMGKSEKNISIIMNLVQIKEKADIFIPSFVTVREGLADSQNVSEFYDCLFPQAKSPFGLNYIIADGQNIMAIQALPNKISKNYLNDTQIHSNTYLNKSWKEKLLDPHYSEERQEYSEEVLHDAYKNGDVTNKELLELLSDEPVICRDEEGILGVGSLAFFTSDSFGCGTANQNVGSIPI